MKRPSDSAIPLLGTKETIVDTHKTLSFNSYRAVLFLPEKMVSMPLSMGLVNNIRDKKQQLKDRFYWHGKLITMSLDRKGQR